MPTYRITGPDGRTYEVSAPEGATQDQVLAYARQNAQQAPRKSQYTEAQLMPALRKADAAGDAQAARAIARRIRSIREAAGQPGPWPQNQAGSGEDGQPIEVDLPGGQVAEFPSGTPRDVMERALQSHHRESQIDVSQVQWDGPPQRPPAGGIDPNAVQWDDDPAPSQAGAGSQYQGLPITDLPAVTSRPDFSGVSAAVDSTEADPATTAPDGWKYGAGRDVAFGGRSVLQGVGGLVGALGGDAFNHYIGNPIARTLGMQETAPYREVGAQLADKLNLPKAQTAGDRVMGDVGEALTGTGLTLGLGGLLNTGRSAVTAAVPTVRSRLAELLTAQPKLQAVSTATGSGAAAATREGGGGTGAQTLAGLLGGLSPAVTTSGGAATLRGLMRGGSGETMQSNITAFRATGATPSVGQAAGNRRLQGAESLLAGAPTSAGVMSRFAERQAQSIGGGLQNKAEGLFRNASGERAGKAIERGVGDFADNIAATRSKLYAAADVLIPTHTQVPLSNTRATLSALTAIPAGASATGAKFVNPQIKALAADIERDLAASRTAGPMGTLAPTQGGIPYETVRAIRTRLGKELSDFSLSTDRPTAQLKELYGALSRDIEQTAAQQGPAAAQAAKRASNFYKLSADRLDELQRVVDKNGGSEKVFNAVMAGTRDGGSTLRAVMQSLPKEGRRALTGAVIKRMGLANPGMQDAAGEAFSAQTFLTNWNKVSPEAKRALFDRHGPQFAASMDRVAQVAENIRNGSRVFANPSGTANRAAAYGYAISLLGSLGTGQVGTFGGLAAGGVGANVLARAFTNPAFVNWLARSTTVPIGALPAQLQTVRQLAEAQGDESVVEVARALEARLQAQGDSLGGNLGPRRGNPLMRAADGR